jgi:hypothetical protein
MRHAVSYICLAAAIGAALLIVPAIGGAFHAVHDVLLNALAVAR